MSTATIGNLNVKLAMDTAQFSSGVREAQSKIAVLGNALKAFAAGAVAGLSLGAVTAALRSATNQIDEMGKTAQKIGIPVEELSKLEFAARLADVSLEDLAGSVGKFSKGLAEMQATGKGSAADALNALNIAAVDAQGNLRPTAEIIADVADRFSRMQDGANKTAIAMALFGKSGANLIPLLNGGRDAIAGAADEAQRFGLVLSSEAAAAAEQFNDNMTRLNAVGEGVTKQFVQGLNPALGEITDLMVEGASVSEGFRIAGHFLGQTFKVLASGVLILKAQLEAAYAVMVGFARGMANVVTGDFEAAAAAIGTGFTSAFGEAKEAIDGIEKLWDSMSLDPPEINVGKSPGPKLPRSGSQTKAPRWQDPGYTSIAPSQQGELSDSASYMTDAFEEAQQTAEDLAGTITDSLAGAIEGLVTGTMSFKDSWKSMASSLLSSLTDIASALMKSGLLSLLGNLGTQFGGAMGLGSFGGLYAKGGYLGAGKWGVAGENGAEIVHGPANITPVADLMGGGGFAFSPTYNIDARGATAESVDRLRMELDARDSRLRREFPGMIRQARQGGKI